MCLSTNCLISFFSSLACVIIFLIVSHTLYPSLSLSLSSLLSLPFSYIIFFSLIARTSVTHPYTCLDFVHRFSTLEIGQVEIRDIGQTVNRLFPLTYRIVKPPRHAPFSPIYYTLRCREFVAQRA